MFIILDAWGWTPHTSTGLARKSVEVPRENGGRIFALIFAKLIAGLTDISVEAGPNRGAATTAEVTQVVRKTLEKKDHSPIAGAVKFA